MKNNSLFSTDFDINEENENNNGVKTAEVLANEQEEKKSVQETMEKMEETIRKKKQEIPFWGNDPNVLLHQKYMFELFPVKGMSYSQKLNAITRMVLILSIISILYSFRYRTVFVAVALLSVIFAIHYYQTIGDENKDLQKKVRFAENFENSEVVSDLVKQSSAVIPNEIFDTPDSGNPFGNVLVTDYDYNPDKKPAPPAFNRHVNDKIVHDAKQLVQNANPDQPDIADKLFKDLGSQLVFEQSLRPFHSNPSTTIPNDQIGFAEFCYGSMISCKEGNQFACARNLARHTN